MTTHPATERDAAYSATATVAAHVLERSAATSDYQLSVEPFRAVPRTDAQSLLSLAPGVFLVNHAGTYHASSLYTRGFDAGEGQDVEMRVDGVPVNEVSNAHLHGYADVSFLIPEVVDSVSFLMGPFAAAQTDFSVAGTANYALGPSRRGLTVRGEHGSFASRRLLLLWAPRQARAGTFLGVDLRDADGFGVNRASTSGALNGRWELEVAPDLRVHVFGAAQLAAFASAGMVRDDDVRLSRLPCAKSTDAQLFCTQDPNQGGASQRALLAAGVTWHRAKARFDALIFGGYRALRIRENFTGMIVDPRGDGLDEQYHVGTVGFDARYRLDRVVLGHTQQLEAGVTVRHDSGSSRQLRMRAVTGVPYTASFDDELHITRLGAHVGADVQLSEWLALRAGVRADMFAFGVVSRTFPTSDRVGDRLPEQATDAMGVALQPRGTVRVRLVELAPDTERGSSRIDWQTSLGVGTRSSDATRLSQGERAPFATVIASETGLRVGTHAHRDLALDARLVGFHTHVDHDLVFDPVAGRNIDYGATSRLGISTYVDLSAWELLAVRASFAWTEAYLRTPAWSDFVSDARLPYVPRWVGRFDAAAQRSVTLGGEHARLSVGLGVGWLGQRPIPFGQVAPAVVLVDAQAMVEWHGVELALLVQNLADVRWQSAVSSYASWFDASQPASQTPALSYSAGAPRAFILRLTVRLDDAAASPSSSPARETTP